MAPSTIEGTSTLLFSSPVRRMDSVSIAFRIVSKKTSKQNRTALTP